MEQLGNSFENLLDYFLEQKCKIFIHIEPIIYMTGVKNLIILHIDTQRKEII